MAAEFLIALVHEPIDATAVRDHIMGDPAHGGICTFEGATRAEQDAGHGALVRLEYEAYESMARRQMEDLAAESVERFGAGRVAIVHRLGHVPPAQVSVMIAVACPHRDQAFAACRFLIDALKQEVAVWKRDVFEDGHTNWVEPVHEENG